MRKTLLLSVSMLHFVFFAQNIPSKITIDFKQKGAIVQPSMYGIFFEEINNAGDGGLYSEMILNRAFEDHTPPTGSVSIGKKYFLPSTPSYATGLVKGQSAVWNNDSLQNWKLNVPKAAKAYVSVQTVTPLNSNSPHYAQLDILQATSKDPISLINGGYWGISVEKNKKYKLRFFSNIGANYKGHITAIVRSDNGQIIASKIITSTKKTSGWVEYNCQLTAFGTNHKGTFELQFDAPVIVKLDFISLSPANSYKNRPYSFRSDVVKMLEGLKPAFMRWPGGCVVEGATVENRIKWKETLGDPAQRKGEYMKWGYRNTYGFGYHEFLQFCEDMKMDGMFVANVGLACEFNNGDYCTEESVDFFIQDALDALEYAIGDAKTTWGAKRVAAGHSKPFSLKYVQIGNENHSAIYEKRYNQFYTRLKAAYPEVELIFNGVATGAGGVQVLKPEFNVNKIEIADYHWYDGPDWFYNHVFLFDKIQPRHDFKIYVGEYACHRKVGSGNLFGALSEAAFIMGMERNSDLITMTSYAPLIENSNRRKWPVNMMMLNNHQIIGRSSYYVQKMFANNRPSYNLSTHLLDEKGSVIDSISGLRQYAQAGYDQISGEIVLKIVNATPNGFAPLLEIKNTRKINRFGEMIYISAADSTFENSFENPLKIYPLKKRLKNLSTGLKLKTAPWSFNIIRIKVY
jgi:alpha-N-arabinofuranosidase